MKTYRVTLCREYWGYINIKANSAAEAMQKVEDYDYEGEFVITKIGNQSVYSAKLIESEVEEG